MDERNEVHFDGKIAQKVIVLQDNRVLLMRDPREPEEIWELPGGRMNEGEEPRTALARELREELGVEFSIHEVVHMEQFFQKSENRNAFVIVYRGTLVNPSASFVLAHDEVAEVKWVSVEDWQQYRLFPEYRRALEAFTR